MSKFFVLFLSALFYLQGAPSELDDLIGPEIKNDRFYQAIYQLARTEKLSTILEIGSSSGEGSTDAFVKAIQENPSHPHLFCMEVSSVRYAALKNHYAHIPAVKCYQASSVPLSSFPSEKEVVFFYKNIKSNLRKTPLDRVLGWLKQDIDYVKTSAVSENGIEQIKKENGIKTFDMVLIDGSEFTGAAELKLVYGARFILLDDINTFKNYHNYRQLRKDPAYELVEKNKKLRNGFAIFKRR